MLRPTTIIAIALAVALAGCGGDEPQKRDADGPLTIGVLAPFSGPIAQFGRNALAGCEAGVRAVNEQGVLGHKLTCRSFDTGGNPATAPPAANELVQSADDVVMVIGPSDEAPATAPIVTSSGIPNFITAGNSRFDVNREPYLFRLTPSDTDLGAALGHFGFRAGSRAAAVFTNDLGAQTTVAPLRAAYKARERSLAADITVRLAQRSYRREVARLVEANPDVIITELDAATAGVFFKDLRRAVRTLPPILTTSRSNNPKWIGTMENAIGAAAVRRLVKFVGVGMAIGEPAHTEYSELLEHIDPQLGDPEQYVKQPWAMADYDAVIVTALAMSRAKSAEPSEYRRHIREVTGDPRGWAVQTYAEGLAALAKGRAIRYVGASGSLTFDENQSVRRGFTLLEHDRASGALAVAAAVEPDELAR